MYVFIDKSIIVDCGVTVCYFVSWVGGTVACVICTYLLIRYGDNTDDVGFSKSSLIYSIVIRYG